jgi:short-subunit dehydrogenase
MATAKYDKSKLVELGMMSADDVAAAGYRALMKGERVAVTGATNKVISVAAQMAPRSLVLAVTDRLLRAKGDR